MLHSLAFEEELSQIKETNALLDRLWNEYMVKPGANYNQDWRIVLQKLSDLIGAIECEEEEYQDYRNR